MGGATLLLLFQVGDGEPGGEVTPPDTESLEWTVRTAHLHWIAATQKHEYRTADQQMHYTTGGDA